MSKFLDWIRENYGGSVNDPSNVSDEGEGGDGVARLREKPAGNPAQGFPSYTLDGSDLPVTKKHRAAKGCRKCGKK